MKGTLIFLLSVFFTVQAYAQTISGIVNQYRKVLWVDSANGRVRLSDVSGFETLIGNKAMLLQMKGAIIDQPQTAAFGNILNISNAGNYEIGTICGFLNDTLVFERKLNNWYSVDSLVQCIILPKYTNVTVTDTLKAQPWDSTAGTGGVIALEVTGTLFLDKPIDAGGAGFKGGTYLNYPNPTCFTYSGQTNHYMANNPTSNNQGAKKGEGIAHYISGKEHGVGKQSNGGGGGNRFNAGGAGGSNYGAGGSGGLRNQGACQSNTTAVGGVGLSVYYGQEKIFLGGGGGGGHANEDFGLGGGNGGGIVCIIANNVVGNSGTPANNKIMANGAMPLRYFGAPFNFWTTGSASDGAGGGGGAGAILLQVNNFSGNPVIIEANGAKGGNSEIGGNTQCCGPGGGGGGGLVWFKSASLPAGVTASANGGTNGIVEFSGASCNGSNNSAGPGSNGAILFNHVFPVPGDTSPVCRQVLPVSLITDFRGRQQKNFYQLWVTVSDPAVVAQCILQRAIGGLDFKAVAEQQANGKSEYYFTDAPLTGSTILYRVKIITKDGRVFYSAVLRFRNTSQKAALAMDLYPNPSSTNLSLQVYSPINDEAGITVFDEKGRQLLFIKKTLSEGLNAIALPITILPSGQMFLKLTTKGKTLVRPFIK